MRRLDTIVRNVIDDARSKTDSRARTKAYEHASDFFSALADAMDADLEIEDTTAELRRAPDDHEWQAILKCDQDRRYAAIERAGVALQLMPLKFAALLEIELNAVKSNVVPITQAAQ